jgi:MFS family permease
VAVLVGGVLLHSMNVLMLATVLPSVVDNLGGATLMSWTSSAFLASSIVAATCTGYLTSILGARTVFCTGAAIFGLGALTCALAPTMGQVVAGRFVQGFGGGLLTAMAVILVVVALRALPLSATSGASARVPGLRVLLICVAIAGMSLMAIAPGVPAKILLLAGAIAALMVTLRIDRRAPQPLLPTDAFSFGSLTGVGLWLCLLVAIAYSPLQIFVAIFLQSLHGLDPLEAGYMVAGASFGWTGMSLIVAGTPADRSDRLLIAGPLMMAVGLLGVALLMPLKPAPVVFPAIALVGAGIGSCWAFVAQRVMSGARAGEENLAASSLATVQQTGFALGAALAGLAANAAGLSAGLTRTDVAEAAFWVPMSFVLAALAGIAAGLRLMQLRRRVS